MTQATVSRRDELDAAHAAGDGDRLAELALDAMPYFEAAAGPEDADERQAVRDLVLDEVARIVAGRGSYDPAKQPLKLYLAMVAKRKLLNHRRDEARRAKRDPAARASKTDLDVADLPGPGNRGAMAAKETLDDLLHRAAGVLPPRDIAFLRALRAGADADDLLALLGERDPAAVKRARDRIVKTIKRKVLP